VSFWPKGEAHQKSRARFHRLAHENREPYRSTFQAAAQLYSGTLAAEGHRHYPLRAVRSLRTSPDLLLPLAPFLDDWGGMIATHPLLTPENRVETVGALIAGCRRVPNQSGYQRALAGFAATSQRGFQDAAARLSASLQRDLRSLRKAIDVPRISYESTMSKRVLAIRERVRAKSRP